MTFVKLILLSHQERKARVIEFDPATTIFTGPNDTGKSSILKSVFRVFGAEVPIHPDWQSANVIILLRFMVGASNYTILRHGGQFTVFDSAENVLGSFDSVTNGLGPYLARLFSFGLVLTDKAGASRVPPPAFLFLPYYFDQDRSWTEPWRAFERLQQFSHWKQDLIEYHTGIRSNAFYEAKGQQAQLSRERETLTAEQNLLRTIRSELKEKLDTVTFSIDLEAFREEITELVVECEKIQKTAEEVRARLVALHNERISIEAQIEIVKGSLKEISADYGFLVTRDHVECPTCGADYDSDFKARFEIALDADRCQELLQELGEELARVSNRITRESTTYNKHETEVARIQGILSKRKEEVQLKDLIENESKRQVAGVLQDRVSALTAKITENENQYEELRRRLAALTDEDVKESISREFREEMRRNLFALRVHGLPEAKYKNVNAQIRETGSDLPRALLAYGFSILAVVSRHTSSVNCPIVIDSPIQQDQDQENHERILTFIRDKRPPSSQLLIGVVDTKGVEFGGRVIQMNGVRSVLLAAEYSAAQPEVDRFMYGAMFFHQL